MAAYGSMDYARAGLAFGLDHEIETRIAASGVTFEFGDPVYVKNGDEDTGFAGDSDLATLKFLGVAAISQRSFVASEGEYPPFDAMNVLSEGEVYVTVASGLTTIANQAAYVYDDDTNAQYGLFTTLNSAATYGPVGYFRSNAEDSLARLQVGGGLK